MSNPNPFPLLSFNMFKSACASWGVWSDFSDPSSFGTSREKVQLLLVFWSLLS